MSIQEINLIKKLEVFFRLRQENEKFIDALSKAGIILPTRLLSLLQK